MSLAVGSQRACYVHCNLCSTILAVSIPGGTSFCSIVTVRCGHCANLLPVNIGTSLQAFPPQDLEPHQKQPFISSEASKDCASSSRCDHSAAYNSANHEQHIIPSVPRDKPTKHLNFVAPEAPEKRQRNPSAYNKFIKEEIKRIKASNPKISHRDAFSTAAKNWAHLPHSHFGLNLDGNKQAKLDPSFAEGT